MANNNKGIYLRTDLFSQLSNSRLGGLTADLLNKKALPLFEEFGIEISKENALKYCVKGGLDQLMNDMLGIEKDSKLLNISKSYLSSVINKHTSFPQFDDDDVTEYKKWLNFVTVGTVRYSETVRDKNGVPKEVEKEKTCFVCDNEAVIEASKVYVSTEYEKDYKELANLCEKINDYFGKPGKVFSDLYSLGLMLDVNTCKIMPDNNRINDEYFKMLRNNRD